MRTRGTGVYLKGDFGTLKRRGAIWQLQQRQGVCGIFRLLKQPWVRQQRGADQTSVRQNDDKPYEVSLRRLISK